jgi:hypothetical protein
MAALRHTHAVLLLLLCCTILLLAQLSAETLLAIFMMQVTPPTTWVGSQIKPTCWPGGGGVARPVLVCARHEAACGVLLCMVQASQY